MNANELDQMLSPANVLMLGNGLQMASSLVLWLAAELRADGFARGMARMQIVAAPVFLRRAARQNVFANAVVLPFAQPAFINRAKGASAIIERDAA
jgi:hypothetical protein